MKKAVLLDVSAIMYRSYFSLKEMRNRSGMHTGAVYGFAALFYRVVEEFAPDYIYACFDVKRSELKRKLELDSYKDNRESAPEELISQIPLIEQFLDGYGVDKMKVMGYEADDVLATVATKLKKEGVYATIITADKDMAQVVEEGIEIALMQHGKFEFHMLKTGSDVLEKFGVYPEQIPDFFGLKGDASDGIPGVKGVGDKTAQKLISEFTTLEGVYENIESLKGKMRENLENDKEMAFLSRKLATAHRDLEITLNLSPLVLTHQKQASLFKQCGFSSYIKKFKIESEPEMAGTLFSVFETPQVETISESEELEIVEKSLSELKQFQNALFSIVEKEGEFFLASSDKVLYKANVNELEMLLSSECVVVGYHLKESVLKSALFTVNAKLYDVMMMEHLLSPDMKISEEGLYEKYGVPMDFSTNSSSGVFKHLKALESLYTHLKEELVTGKLLEVYERFEMPLLNLLSHMEQEGIEIDVPHFEAMSVEILKRIKELETLIFFHAGEEFNLNSPKQLGVVLFEKLQLPVIKKTKTGYSTDAEVLDTLAKNGVEVATLLLEYRELAKLLSTYVSVIPTLVDEMGRIHTTFNQMGTATGRLSSVNPNLQNIPSKTEIGKRIRKGFVAKSGYTLLSADYSQIELRVLAELTGDEALIKAYQQKQDLHRITAEKLFLKSGDEITSFERMVGKTINFSVIYGKTAYGLAGELGISMKEATSYIQGYFNQYPAVRSYLEEICELAKTTGETHTYFNRRRIILNITSTNRNLREHANRAAMNSVIQGSASDIIKLAMIEIAHKISNSEDIKMLLQIHDELIFEVKEECVEGYCKMIREIMEQVVDFKNVPLEVNISTGKNWEALK